MCGIAGIIRTEGEVHQIELSQMTDVLKHRGPDGEGQWISPDRKVGLGHRRLSILDLSLAGSQPMMYKNRWWITYNGEIYNYKELRENLEKNGHYFQSDTDTEVLLQLYSLKGSDFLSDLDGMFSFAIWDSKEETLFCARDRFGEKPFYFHNDANGFYFASEIKSLFQLGIDRNINLKKVYDYMVFSTIENPMLPAETFFESISSLEPAHFIILKANKIIKKVEYWSLRHIKLENINFKNAKEHFLDLFTTSIRLRMRSDVQIGSSLSGGLDSSSIVSVLNNLLVSGSSQHVYSARFPGFQKDEGHFIDLVCKGLRQDVELLRHEVFLNGADALDTMEKIMYHQEEPFGSSSIVAQFEVMKLASDTSVKVLLDGQGADELLAGYFPFYKSYLTNVLRSNPLKYFEESKKIRTISGFDAGIINKHDLPKVFCNTLNSKIGNLRRSKLDAGSKFFKGLNKDFVMNFQDRSNKNVFHQNIKEHSTYLLTKRGINELLRYADRNSMAHSVEVRLPFLSHKLVEFVFSLPDSFLINEGWTKYILRESMSEIIPSEIQWRKDKIGYEPPQKDWLSNKRVQDRILNSFQILKENKIVSEYYESYNWQYLMLGLLINR